MKDYLITLADGGQDIVKAAYVQQDGMGTRLLDDKDRVVATYNSGEVRSCRPKSAERGFRALSD